MLLPHRRTVTVALLGVVLVCAPGIFAGKLVSPNSRLKMLISRPLNGGELLYNGIRLHKAWPPDYVPRLLYTSRGHILRFWECLKTGGE